MTSDLPATFLFMASLWCFRAMLRRFTVGRVLTSAVVLGGLFVTKMSAVLIVPVLCAMIAADFVGLRAASDGELANRDQRAARVRALTVGGIIQLVVVLLVIWMCYGFRFTAFSPGGPTRGRFFIPWQWVLDQPTPRTLLSQLNLTAQQKTAVNKVLGDENAGGEEWSNDTLDALAKIRSELLTPEQRAALNLAESAPPASIVPKLVQWARVKRLLPEAYLYGYAYVWRRARAQPQFFNGKYSPVGWRSFLPFTFLVKTPLPMFGILALAAAAALSKCRDRARRENLLLGRAVARAMEESLPLWLFALVYGSVAIMSRINIGHRHILPIYGPLFIFCGASVSWPSVVSEVIAGFRKSLRTIGSWMLVAALLAETVYRSPNFLAYFNGIVQPARAYRYVVDSSLDWGQELPAIKAYLTRQPPSEPTFLAYFGTSNPTYYGVQAKLLYSHPSSARSEFTPLYAILGAAPAKDDPIVADILKREPNYDPNLICEINIGGKKGALLLIRSSALRWTAGTYLVSASLLQPIFYPKAQGQWSASYEQTYQQLRADIRRFLADDELSRVRFLSEHTIADAVSIVYYFEMFRFARLAAFLRNREPDGNINFSILVYRLSAADIERATEGPPP